MPAEVGFTLRCIPVVVARSGPSIRVDETARNRGSDPLLLGRIRVARLGNVRYPWEDDENRGRLILQTSGRVTTDVLCVAVEILLSGMLRECR